MRVYLLAYVFKYLFVLIGAHPVIAASGDGGLESHQAVITRQGQQRPQPNEVTQFADIIYADPSDIIRCLGTSLFPQEHLCSPGEDNPYFNSPTSSAN